MKTINLGTIAALLIFQLTLISCEREYDKPPIDEIPVGGVIHIDSLKGMYSGFPVSFNQDLSLYATVTSDETTGNFYKEAYIQDGTGAIKLRLLAAGGLYLGDSIRVYLRGTVLTTFNGLLQLDSVDVDKNLIKQAVGRHVEPLEIALKDITPAHQSMLVKIPDVEFVGNEIGTTWANAAALAAINRNLTDCDGNTRLLRTSGYANFAGQTLPSGHGYLTAIVSVFNSDLQLFINHPSDVVFHEPRCTPPIEVVCNPVEGGLVETFTDHLVNDVVNGMCWSTFATQGTLRWLVKDVSGNRLAEASIAGTGDNANEMWMITPEIKSAGSDVLSFDSSCQNWNHDGLSVWVSKDFNGSNVNAATWTQLSPNLATQGTANNALINSGNINLSSALGAGYNGTYYIGYKYSGSGPGGQTTTYRIDNVSITQ